MWKEQFRDKDESLFLGEEKDYQTLCAFYAH